MSEYISRFPTTLNIARRIYNWVPPFLWMAAIFVFSTDYFSAGHTGGIVFAIVSWFMPNASTELQQTIHFLVRKAGHFSVYAILAFLLMRALRSESLLRWRWNWAMYSFLVVGIYALLDEYHQSFTTSRTGSVYDSLIDLTGGTVMLTVLWLLSFRKSRQDNS